MGNGQVDSRRGRGMMKAYMKAAVSPPMPTMVDTAVKTVV